MSGQVSRGRAQGEPQGGMEAEERGSEGPEAGPTLAGTLETCVLGAESWGRCREIRPHAPALPRAFAPGMPGPSTLQQPACFHSLPSKSPHLVGGLAPKQALPMLPRGKWGCGCCLCAMPWGNWWYFLSTALPSGKGVSEIVHPRGIVLDTPGQVAMESLWGS